MKVYPLVNYEGRPILSLCICALEKRKNQSAKLFAELKKQAEEKPVEVLIAHDNGEETSGAKRHLLSVGSRGDYIAFIDDDDFISEDYVDLILEGCGQSPEVVTFNSLVEQTNGKTSRVNMYTFAIPHDVKPLGFKNDLVIGDFLLVGMHPSHLCAWRRDIQRKFAYDPKLNCKDDASWIEPLIASGIASDEYRIPKILYYYRFSNSGTENQTSRAKMESKEIVREGFECFREGTEFFIADLPIDETEGKAVITCRDSHNNLIDKNREGMDRFHVFTLPW